MTEFNIEEGISVLPIAILQIDIEYQRELRPRIVKEILEDGYDLDAAWPIIVSERPPLPGMNDPRYYIVDGQHRVEVARQSGEDEVLCKLVKYKGTEQEIIEQEAALRTKMGVRKADTPMERFKSKLKSKDEEALAITRIVESYGGTISLSPNSRHGLKAISTCEKLYRRGILDDVLRIIKLAWDSLDDKAGESGTLDALAWFVTKHQGRFNEGHLTRRLKGVPPEAVFARAHAIKVAMGGSLWKNIYRAMIEIYNTRQPDTAKLTPVEF